MKAVYYQFEKGKTGLKVTAWRQEFHYRETCGNVYLTKKIYRNGNKSTVTAYAKASGQDVSDSILTCNTYFWYSGSSAGQRRSNERKRNNELEGYMIDNYEEAYAQVNALYSNDIHE